MTWDLIFQLGGSLVATAIVFYITHKTQPKVFYPTGRAVIEAARSTDSRKVRRTEAR